MTTHSKYDKYLPSGYQRKELTDKEFKQLINETIAYIKWQNQQAEKWQKWGKK